MDANVTQTWLIVRAAGRQMLKQATRQDHMMSSARGAPRASCGYTAIAPRNPPSTDYQALGCEWAIPASPSMALGRPYFGSPLTQWMFEDSERSREVRKGFLARVPKGRLGEPSDLAGRCCFSHPRRRFLYRPHPLRRGRLHRKG